MGRGNFSQNFSPLALTVWELRFVEDIQSYEDISKTMNQLISQLMTEVIAEHPRLHRSVKKHTMIFLLLFGIWLCRVGLLCTLQQSIGLHFNPLNYTALL